MWPILVSVSGSKPRGQEEASRVKPGQGVVWKHQPLLISNQTQVGGRGRWSLRGLEDGGLERDKG